MFDAAFSHRPSARAAAFLAREQRLLIDGDWVSPLASGVISVFDPATDEQIASVAGAEAAAVAVAVAAACRAFEAGPWRRMGGAARARLIWRLSDLPRGNPDELADLETFDKGKPPRDPAGEWRTAATESKPTPRSSPSSWRSIRRATGCR